MNDGRVTPLYRRKRLLLSAWRRRTRWEFWPSWTVYAPLALHMLGLAIRHRGVGTFAACNPGIPGGGLVGESKSAILDLIPERAAVARYAVVSGGLTMDTACQEVRDFMRREGLDFPVVLKPDWGQRGLGVAVIRDEAALRGYFAQPRPDTLVQEFVSGDEFGIFYYRFPGAERGVLHSITRKQFPRVTGDGQSTLERLILADDRAVCSARFFLRRHAGRLDWVPAAGESVQLTDIGNHCRGTMFLDGQDLRTPALLDTMDRIARDFRGFHFGRFDLRCPSADDLRAGRALRIMEVNGVSAESTHMYDPRHGYWHAQRILREQWSLAFAIGAENRRRGAAVPTVAELVRLLKDYAPAPEA